MPLSPLSASQRTALEMAVREYHEQLQSSERVLNYIYSRGISDETIAEFRLGAVTTPIDDSHRKFLGGLVIPNRCASHDEHVVGIKVRNLDPEAKPKYTQPSGQTARLFNLRAIKQATTRIAATEGELDAIILSQAGIPAIGIPGANQWTGHRYRARMFDGLDLVLFADNDDAGQDLVRSMADLHNLTVRYPERPAKDVNDQWLQTGQDVDAFRAWAKGEA